MRTPTRRIKDKLDDGERAFGAAVSIASPDIVEIVGYVGYDFVWIDAEHGTMELTTIASLIRAAEAVQIDSIVRVPDGSPSFIQRVLDAGATGVLVPHVRSVEDAEAIVRASKYPPAGQRGACPGTRNVGRGLGDWVLEYRRADRDVIVWALVEDVEGVAEVERIAQVPGLDGLMFGPFDLAQAMGFDGDTSHPDVVALMRKAVAAAQASGLELVSLGTLGEPDGHDGAQERGARVVVGDVDVRVLVSGLQATLAALDEKFKTAAGGAR